jgi:hypothetical protein
MTGLLRHLARPPAPLTVPAQLGKQRMKYKEMGKKGEKNYTDNHNPPTTNRTPHTITTTIRTHLQRTEPPHRYNYKSGMESKKETTATTAVGMRGS